MARIQALEPNQADPKSRELFAAVEKKMGRVPNLLKGLGNSPAALEAYLALSGAVGGGTLSTKLREQIALATAGVNGCSYCASAHTAVGKSLKVDADELTRNLSGQSSDPRTAVVLSFVQSVLATAGHVADEELEAVRAAGFTDGEVAEIVTSIALNVFTNYFNGVAGTEIDFPKVDAVATTV